MLRVGRRLSRRVEGGRHQGGHAGCARRKLIGKNVARRYGDGTGQVGIVAVIAVVAAARIRIIERIGAEITLQAQLVDDVLDVIRGQLTLPGLGGERGVELGELELAGGRVVRLEIGEVDRRLRERGAAGVTLGVGIEVVVVDVGDVVGRVADDDALEAASNAVLPISSVFCCS